MFSLAEIALNLYLISEPSLLDGFIQALRAVSDGHRIDAEFEAVDSPWTFSLNQTGIINWLVPAQGWLMDEDELALP